MADGGQTWSDERVARLRLLWDEGNSASRIAAELGGMTRNMVMGKAHRLGLCRTRPDPAHGGQPVARIQPRPPSEPRIPAHAPALAPKSCLPAIPAASSPLARTPPAEPPGATSVTIMDLSASMCRWPLGDPSTPSFRFCGASAATGQPYCVGHCGMAYEPERRRAARA